MARFVQRHRLGDGIEGNERDETAVQSNGLRRWCRSRVNRRSNFRFGGVHSFQSSIANLIPGASRLMPSRRFYSRAADRTATPYLGNITELFAPPSSTSVIFDGSVTVCCDFERFTRIYTAPFGL